MKKFVEPEMNVTKFEYENLMNNTDISGTVTDTVVPDPDPDEGLFG